MRGRLQPERQHLGVGRRLVGAAEGFDAGLQEFGRRVARGDGTPGRDSRSRPACRQRRGEIVARDRNGQVGPQAEFAAARRGGQVHALADVLAGQVEERLGRLQDRGRDAAIAGALIGGDQRLRAHIRLARQSCLPLPGIPAFIVVFFPSRNFFFKPAPFSTGTLTFES